MTSAFILAGGQGKRLLPYTQVLPKPLMPLGNRTIIENLIDQITKSGITKITVSLGYLGYLIESVLEPYSKKIDLSFTRETKPLGTAGALSLIPKENLNSEILIINGDTLTNFKFIKAIEKYKESKADILIVCKSRINIVDFGVIEIGKEDNFVEYNEKPSQNLIVSTGIYVLRPAIIDRFVPKDVFLDMPTLISNIHKCGGKVTCMIVQDYWKDLGRIDDLNQANLDFQQKFNEN
jgi:NDP-sugar pyrophosphorylase family protein